MRPWWLVAGLALAAPGSAQRPETPIPAGHGTLTQEDVALRIENDQLLVTVLPLAEGVIRLLTPDAWSALSQLVAARQAEVDSAARRAGVERPTLFLVSFYARDRGTSFDPDDLAVTGRGQFFRPLGFVPVTPGWGTRQLEQRQRAIAIVLFEPDISPWEAMDISYGAQRTSAWERTLRQLEQERAAVLARAAAAGHDSLPSR